ncbi:MAG: right-handed parallel beta-helix repeat-containing protein [Planctomycetota bacterium]
MSALHMRWAGALALAFWMAAPATADVLRVGPGRTLTVPSQAAAQAKPGDVVLIDAGVYVGDVAVWRADDLTIRGVGGLARLEAGGQSAQGKAIWVVQGNRITIESIEFTGARVPDKNGAGIRQEGTHVTIRRCVFRDNENGILTSPNESSDILIEECEFDHNGHGDGYSHNLYVGHVRSLTVRSSYIHHARVGHNLKSRARKNVLLHNRIMDETDGNGSIQAEFPNGGEIIALGNVFHQGRETLNVNIISFGGEGQLYERNVLCVVNNTFVNDRQAGTFVQSGRDMDFALVANNLFIGAGRMMTGEGDMAGNLQLEDASFVDREHFDFRLRADSPAIDAGVDPGTFDGLSLLPEAQYRHESRSSGRSLEGGIDVGAFERGGEWSLMQQPLRRGSTATVVISRLEPGDFVFFLASFQGFGPGERVPGGQGLTLDLVGDVWLAGSTIANGSGTALLTSFVPADAPLGSVSSQALVFRKQQGRFVKTNVITASIQPD